MRTITLPVLAALGLGALTLPSAALPVAGPDLVAGSGSGLTEVRMRRHRMHHRRTVRRAVPRDSASQGNASMPRRGAAEQQYGGTSGGPRR